jgi:TRAP-type C4-dicarboxylate transport system permease small subunit
MTNILKNILLLWFILFVLVFGLTKVVHLFYPQIDTLNIPIQLIGTFLLAVVLFFLKNKNI